MPVVNSDQLVLLFERRLHECLGHRLFQREEEIRVVLVGTLLELGVDLAHIWPEYPLVFENGRFIDLIVDSFPHEDSLAFEIKYERSRDQDYQPGAATGPVAKDIMRLAAVHAHQRRRCFFILLMDDEAHAALARAQPGVGTLLSLAKGATRTFDWTTLKPDQDLTYLRALDGIMNPCNIECLSDCQVGNRHVLRVYRVSHTPDAVYDWAG